MNQPVPPTLPALETALLRLYQSTPACVEEGATHHLVAPEQQMKNPKQSLPTDVHDPRTPVQYPVVGPVTQVTELPHAPLRAASSCSPLFHLPEGTVWVHTVQLQQQQQWQ